MEGHSQRLALQLQMFDFSTKHRQEPCNQHADALSCKPVTMVAINTKLDTYMIAPAQQLDPVLSAVLIKKHHHPPATGENSFLRDINRFGPS